MIPAQPCVDRLVSQPDLILHKRSLLQVRFTADKTERCWCAGIELREVRDYVAEILVQKRRIRFDSGFPLLPAVMHRNRSLEIPFAKIIMLKGYDRRGIRIGI